MWFETNLPVPVAGLKMVATLDRDVGFSPWEEEEDLDTDMHSPTDVSEDSVDVKVKPVASLSGGCKSKRKCVEPRKFGEEIKRRFMDVKSAQENENSPFRPWSQPTPSGYIPQGYQEEPLSLVLRDSQQSVHAKSRPRPRIPAEPPAVLRVSQESFPGPQEVVRLHHTEPYKGQYSYERDQEVDTNDKPQTFSVESLISERPGTSLCSPSASIAEDKSKSMLYNPQQRNYKNMTRERRIEANARERTRVHTISAAFDTLRRAVPAYSHNQKLSKLSVLRIACSYILTLSRVAGKDYSEDDSQPSLGDCVDRVTRTIQLEGKLRKKKDD